MPVTLLPFFLQSQTRPPASTAPHQIPSHLNEKPNSQPPPLNHPQSNSLMQILHQHYNPGTRVEVIKQDLNLFKASKKEATRGDRTTTTWIRGQIKRKHYTNCAKRTTLEVKIQFPNKLCGTTSVVFQTNYVTGDKFDVGSRLKKNRGILLFITYLNNSIFKPNSFDPWVQREREAVEVK
ncbi:hypothetical protein B0H16DRAFT_1470196 [Mycena metata]|uniref:Uncharacterized protein n=1 Tax=Mycena metata TaxID=1033252 RepID=A0AAD7HWP4_9AGAR|nr:hypothetical protein B0H16DRAFT_1470196 [Mycena metata]